jgi:lipopolysaccharide/colanic/teichoic acid biosynthesis glycosyltransferase
MIVLFAPIFIVLTAYICTVYKVPPIFRHTRVGQNGKRFSCFKFRTMVPDADERLAKMLANDPDLQAEWDATQKLSNDPRILPGVGSLLRKASLDELPQVFNVLLGHMSMVGPRPITENELGFYGEYTEHYMSVRPGITGAWQIAGRSSTSYDDRVSIDVWYVENANLRVDVYIFLKTVFSFCSGRLSGGV